MTRLARKTCPQCGHECLEPEVRCWACGELFVPRTLIPPAGRQAPTLVGYPAPQSARRRRWLLGMAVALGTLVVGLGLHLTAFWYQSEALSPDTVALQPLPSTADSQLRPALPPAPVLDTDPATSGTPVRQPRTNRRVFTVPESPATLPPSNPRPAERETPPPTPRPNTVPSPVRPAGPPAAVLPPAPSPPNGPAAAPPGGDALIAIRNDTPQALDFDFGPDNFSGTVAPYSVVTVPLPGGEYDLALRSSARKDTLYDVRIERGRHYQVAFTGRNTRVSGE
jgi:hypothetical protein